MGGPRSLADAVFGRKGPREPEIESGHQRAGKKVLGGAGANGCRRDLPNQATEFQNSDLPSFEKSVILA